MNSTGIYTPITTGSSVYWDPKQVGSGPDESSANAYLQNRMNKSKQSLWIYEFGSDFSASGSEGQSRMKKDYYQRFFTQPRYTLKGQTANQYEYQKLAKFIRQGMIMQVAGAPLQDGNPQFEAFVLRIEGRESKGRNRNMRGGHAGWTLEGYIESVNTGGERFQFSPEYELTFVLANAVEGPMKILDTTYIPTQIANVRQEYLAGFNEALSSKVLIGDDKNKDKSKDQPTSPPWLKNIHPDVTITAANDLKDFLGS